MLTEQGYKRPTYDELLETEIERAKQFFGEEIDTSDLSTFGKYIRMRVYSLAEIYEDLEKLYYARFPNTANGISLDRLLPFAGITRNLATFAQYKVKFVGNPDFVIDAGYTLVDQNGLIFHTIERCRLSNEGEAETTAESEKSGTDGNFTKILELESPSSDISSIEVLELITKGEEKESDTASRRRFNACKAGAGNMTTNSVKGAIMQVPNVVAAEVFENKTDEPLNGIPPHGFKCYVLCPDYVEYQVAEAIFSKKPIGIPCVGDLTYQVKDNGGQLHEIKFSKSETISVFIQLTVKTNKYFEENGKEQMKDSLIEKISSLKNGESVIFTSLYGQIHKVTGVVETMNLKIAKKGLQASTQNITCEIYQVIDLDKEDITIEVVQDE